MYESSLYSAVGVLYSAVGVLDSAVGILYSAVGVALLGETFVIMLRLTSPSLGLSGKGDVFTPVGTARAVAVEGADGHAS